MTNRKTSRAGTATVEFAVCLPVLVLVILGSIEACNMTFLKQKLTEAAYQGALVAVKPGATESDVETRINNVLAARNIQQTSVDVADGDFEDLESGDTFTITVGAQTGGNRNSPTVVPTLTQIQSSVTATKQ